MILHIARMINGKGEWVDVYYNTESCEVYQSESDPNIVGRLLTKADSKIAAEMHLEDDFGSNVELD